MVDPQKPAHGFPLTLPAGGSRLHVPQDGFACQSMLKSVVISARVDFYEDRRDVLLLLHHPSIRSAGRGCGQPAAESHHRLSDRKAHGLWQQVGEMQKHAHLRHPRKMSSTSAQARQRANALERALRMVIEDGPCLEMSSSVRGIYYCATRCSKGLLHQEAPQQTAGQPATEWNWAGNRPHDNALCRIAKPPAQ